WVAFVSTAGNLVSPNITTGGNNNVYLYEVATGDITLVSHTDSSTTSPASGQTPTISDDGSLVAFVSTTTAPDVYRYKRSDGSLTLISNSTTSETTPSGGINSVPAIS